MSHPHAEFPLGPFTPYDGNPILRPQGDGWESSSVYNPAAVVNDDEVVPLYRAHADDIVTHVGLATVERRRPLRPAPGAGTLAVRGLRALRLRGSTRRADRRHVLPDLHGVGSHERPALSGHVDGPVHVGEARPAVRGLRHVRAQAQDTPINWTKAGVIVATPMDGKWLMYFGEGSIYCARSDDLIHWTPGPPDEPMWCRRRRAPSARCSSRSVRAALPSNGLLVLLHERRRVVRRRHGARHRWAAAFDPMRPTKVIARLN